MCFVELELYLSSDVQIESFLFYALVKLLYGELFTNGYYSASLSCSVEADGELFTKRLFCVG